jgi:hypothetical protein
MARGKECKCHKHPTNIPQEKHHVWPQAYHGPTNPDNLITICCNAHSDIHYFMDYMLKHNGQHPEDWETYGGAVRRYAIKGFNDVMTYGTHLSKEIQRGLS